MTERLWVRFLVRAHAWDEGSILGLGMYRRQPIDFFLTTDVSLSHPLSLKAMKKKSSGENKINLSP